MTKSEKFVNQKIESWHQLRGILLKLSKKNYTSLSDEEVRTFPKLYRLICADLAEARMLKLSPDVLEYLNGLIGQAHQYLYNFKPLTLSMVKAFFLIRFPRVFIENISFILLSMVFFFTPFVISYLIVLPNPDYASLVVSEDILEQLVAGYSEGFTDSRSLGVGVFASSFYIQNNISIAFYSFASGLLFGLGTIYFLVYNGLVLGSISAYINAAGYGNNFWSFVCAHSVFELTGLVLAGAAGLMLGYSIIQGTRFHRKDWLNMKKDRILTIVAASVMLIFTAALIEGNISPQNINVMIKVLIAIFSFFFLAVYFFIIPFTFKNFYETK